MFGALHGSLFGALHGSPLSGGAAYLELLGPGRIDHVADALRRLPAQFSDKPVIAGLLAAFVQPAQTLEAVLYQLATQRDLISGATGLRLDTIGRIVGQPRAGRADDVYRVFLRARIVANRSHGTTPHVLRVLRLLLLGQEARIELTNLGNAAIEVRIFGLDIDGVLAQVLADFLRVTVAAGVRAVLITGPADDLAFAFADCVFATGLLAAGSTDVVLRSNRSNTLDLFPASGVLRFGSGPTSESVAYTARMFAPGDLQSIEFALATPLASDHGVGTSVQIDAADEPGWGSSFDVGQPTLYPYSNVGTTGGRLSNARI